MLPSALHKPAVRAALPSCRSVGGMEDMFDTFASISGQQIPAIEVGTLKPKAGNHLCC